ncbi:MAG: MBOAT family O-acyltransferase, partial [Bacteroidota bacterium]
YGDFAGYSLIAIGAARVIGFRLMDNFRRPYLAASMGELWRRWHISLMSWFRDYLYAPLGGGKKGKVRGMINILIIFTVSGLWHGAAWTFVLFGFLHGLFLVVGRQLQPWRNRQWARLETPEASGGKAALPPVLRTLRRLLGIGFTFFLWLLASPFFRATSFENALLHLKRMFVWPDDVTTGLMVPGIDRVDLLLMIGFIGVFFAVDVLEERGKSLDARLAALPLVPRWGMYLLISLVLLLFGSYGEVPFVYFQF